MNKYSDLQRSASSYKFLPTVKSKRFSQPIELNDEFPRPGSSYFQSPRISSLAQLENEKVSLAITKYYSPKSSEFIFPDSTRLYKTNDFDSILNRIDSITQGKDLSQLKELTDGSCVNLTLEQGSYEDFRVITKDKRSPLKVILKRNFGKLKIMISKNTEKPRNWNSEKVFFSDNFEYFDTGSCFLCRFIYLSIEAVASAQFSISVSFGNLRSIFGLQETKPKKAHGGLLRGLKSDAIKMKFKIGVEELMLKKRKKFQKQSKKILDKNSNVIIDNKTQTKSISSIQEKIAIVQKRKNEKYLEKKTHALESINKKHKRNVEESIKTETKQKKDLLIKIQKSWLSLIYFFISASNIKFQIIDKKLDTILSLQQTASARLIQKVFKSKYSSISLKDNILLHARNNLFLFNSIYHYYKLPITQNLISSIKLSAKCTVICVKFKKFLSKIQVIQKASKTFLLRNKFRIDKILKLWNSTVESLMQKRPSRHSLKYIIIPQHIKEEIVKKYYFEKLSEYIQQIKSVKNSLLNVFKPQNEEFQMPEFLFLPSESELKDMFNEGASLASRINTEGY